MKLGIVANEFFDETLGRMGGFGWAARRAAEIFRRDPSLGVDPVFLTGELRARDGVRELEAHGTRLILRGPSRLANLRRVRAEKIDLLLSIDYYVNYRFLFRALPRTPIVVWCRDPRPPEDWAKIQTLRIPGAEQEQPQGIEYLDRTSLAGIVHESRFFLRPVWFATPAPPLAPKLEGAYGIEPDELFFLPNVLELGRRPIPKSGRPRVVFLGRLDPYKRPWLFVELSARFPDVEFLFLGRAHFSGEGAWEPRALPSNVRLMGHVGEEEKEQLLGSAWALVNTSIHEGLAVSFLEALACGTPLVSCQDPAGIVSRFGIFVGRFDGSGIDGLPSFAAALEQLLGDEELRGRLGSGGREWVRDTHTLERFLATFRRLCARVGLG